MYNSAHKMVLKPKDNMLRGVNAQNTSDEHRKILIPSITSNLVFLLISVQFK